MFSFSFRSTSQSTNFASSSTAESPDYFSVEFGISLDRDIRPARMPWLRERLKGNQVSASFWMVVLCCFWWIATCSVRHSEAGSLCTWSRIRFLWHCTPFCSEIKNTTTAQSTFWKLQDIPLMDTRSEPIVDGSLAPHRNTSSRCVGPLDSFTKKKHGNNHPSQWSAEWMNRPAGARFLADSISLTNPGISWNQDVV